MVGFRRIEVVTAGDVFPESLVTYFRDVFDRIIFNGKYIYM